MWLEFLTIIFYHAINSYKYQKFIFEEYSRIKNILLLKRMKQIMFKQKFLY